jgi:hypothetical protein
LNFGACSFFGTGRTGSTTPLLPVASVIVTGAGDGQMSGQ